MHQGLLHEDLAVLYFLLKLLFLKPVHSAGSLLDDIFVHAAQHKDWLLPWVNAEQNDSLRIDQRYPMVKYLSEVCLSTFYSSLKTEQNSHSKAYCKTGAHAKSCFACSCPSEQAELVGFAFWFSFVQ